MASAPGTLRFAELASKPSTPPVDYALLYVKTDNVVYVQDSSGVETPLGSSSSITSLTGDVTATGPGAAAATVVMVGGQTAAAVAAAAVAVSTATPSNTPNTLVERDGSGNFSAGTITANLNGSSTNFTGSLSGDVTGTQSTTKVVAIQNHAVAVTAPTDAQFLVWNNGATQYVPESISGDATMTNAGVLTLSSTAVTGKLLTGLTPGSNTPIVSTNSILIAFENLQAQISAASGSAITALTGDGTATGPGSVPFTLATVNASPGTFAIATVTVNGKGLVTSATAASTTGTGSVVLANSPTLVTPALGTPSAVVLTNGTGLPLTTGVTGVLPIANGGTNASTANTAFNNLSPMTTAGDIIYENATPVAARLPIGTTGQLLTVSGGLPVWATPATNGTVTSVSVVTANGLAGTVANPTTTPAITLSTPLNTPVVAANGTAFIAGTTTGTGITVVLATSPVLVTPNLGTPSAAVLTNATSLPLTTGVTGVLPIANGGTNNSTAYTAGSVIFSNGTSLTQDNANFFWNDTTFNLGLGTNTPSSAAFIDAVNVSGAAKRIVSTGYGVGSTVGTRTRFARGSLATPAAVQSGDNLGFISAQGYGTSQFPATSTGVLNFVAGETFTNTSNLTYATIQVTPTGSTTSVEAFRVAATGVTLGLQSASTAIHSINGALNVTTRTVTATTLTVDTTTTDYEIFTDSTSNAITITLPTATNGRVLFIQDKTGQAAANHITITPPGAVTINGVNASILIGTNYSGYRLVSDGTNWVATAMLPFAIPTQAIAASNIDWSISPSYSKTLAANTTFTFSNQLSGQTNIVRLTNTASNFTVTWPTVRWAAGTSPTMSTGAVSDVYTFFYDGSNTYGSYIQNMS